MNLSKCRRALALPRNKILVGIKSRVQFSVEQPFSFCTLKTNNKSWPWTNLSITNNDNSTILLIVKTQSPSTDGDVLHTVKFCFNSQHILSSRAYRYCNYNRTFFFLNVVVAVSILVGILAVVPCQAIPKNIVNLHLVSCPFNDVPYCLRIPLFMLYSCIKKKQKKTHNFES